MGQLADHCLRSRDYINVIVAGKQPAPTWLDMDAAAAHCARGLGIWAQACNDTASTETTGSGERAEHRAPTRAPAKTFPEVRHLSWPAA